jgi:DNA-binding protein HU-beta
LPNKAQFIETLAQRLDGDRKRAAAALDAVIDSIYASVAKGERVALTGFGVFEKRERAARTARNPATGEKVRVKKTSVPAFRAGAEFKAITSGAKKLAKAPAKNAGAAAKKTAGTGSRGAASAGSATKTTGRSATKAAPAAKAPAKKAAATKAPAKKAATKAPATKAAATKAPAKKASAAKSTTKSTATKATTKRAPAKRAAKSS